MTKFMIQNMDKPTEYLECENINPHWIWRSGATVFDTREAAEHEMVWVLQHTDIRENMRIVEIDQ